jgi:hypothetical protein
MRLSPLMVVGGVSLLALWGCLDDLCGNQVTQRAMSPSGKTAAVVFTRSCGATTRFSTQVSILPAGRSLPNDGGNTFVTEGKIALALQWENDSTLRIRGAGNTIFKQEKRVNGISVSYGDPP